MCVLVVEGAEVLSPVPPGEVVADKYRVERVLGAGGMGVVVSARHITLDQVVAIKFLAFDPFGEGAEALNRFLAEARAAARIESDHVCRVFDVGQTPNGYPYMVMEYLEGNDLDEELKRRVSLPIVEAVDYVLQAADALAAAHQLGVVHRDIKPANLFLATRPDGSRRVKVLDFGISKSVGHTPDPRSSAQFGSMGTPAYMSPEQIKSPSTVDARTDIWALGAILYELLTGQMAFVGETLQDILEMAMNEDPCPMNVLRRDMPSDLEEVVMTCLSRSREKRWPTPAQLARALAPFGSVGTLTQLASVTRELGSLSQLRALNPPSVEAMVVRNQITTEPDPEELRSRVTMVKDWKGLQTRKRTARTVVLAMATMVCVLATSAIVLHRWNAVQQARTAAAAPAPEPPEATELPAAVTAPVAVPSANLYVAPSSVHSAHVAPRVASPKVVASPKGSSAKPVNHLLDTRD